MTRAAQTWFATFAVIGTLAGATAVALLWLILNHPLRLAQAVAGVP